MNISKENYELVMFDLLEGNLSEQQAIHVMGQIEGDEFLFNEWKLFKSTVLIADKSVTYAKKDALLKETPAVIPMWRTKWAAVAAVACLLVIAIVLFPTGKNDVIVDANPVIDNSALESPSIIQEADDAITPTESVVEELNPTEDVEMAITQPVVAGHVINRQPKVKQLLADPLISTEKDKSVVLDEAPVVLEKKDESEDESVPVKEIIADNSLKTELQDVEIPTPEIALPRDESPNRISFLSELVTLEPKDRIRDRVTTMLSLVRNPKIKLKPHFDGSPSLDIELETTGYQAIASLQPFNKNK